MVNKISSDISLSLNKQSKSNDSIATNIADLNINIKIHGDNMLNIKKESN
jgi:hypothetical protein